jgi:hypothetical protein
VNTDKGITSEWLLDKNNKHKEIVSKEDLIKAILVPPVATIGAGDIVGSINQRSVK